MKRPGDKQLFELARWLRNDGGVEMIRRWWRQFIDWRIDREVQRSLNTGPFPDTAYSPPGESSERGQHK